MAFSHPSPARVDAKRKFVQVGAIMAREGSGVGEGEGTDTGRRGPFGMGVVNALLLGLAALVIVIGYVLLDHGSVTAAPVLLALGYAVLIPAGLLYGYRSAGGDET